MNLTHLGDLSAQLASSYRGHEVVGALSSLEGLGPAYSPLPPRLHSLDYTWRLCSWICEGDSRE